MVIHLVTLRYALIRRAGGEFFASFVPDEYPTTRAAGEGAA